MSSTRKTAQSKMSDEDQVQTYMEQLQHRLKPELEVLRNLIKASDPLVSERIKWNAPSYHFKGTDFLTFNLRTDKNLHLVFHHPAIVKIQSPMLQGEYKDRRMIYFSGMDDLNKHSKEFSRILKEQLKAIKAG